MTLLQIYLKIIKLLIKTSYIAEHFLFKMKTITILIAAFAITVNVYSQDFAFGSKINFGAGKVNSKNLVESFEFQALNDFKIKTWEAKSKLGVVFGLGGFADYVINEQFSIKGELTLNFLSNKFKIDYFEDDVDPTDGNGDKTTIESQAKVKFSYFSLPVLAKYNLPIGENIYALGGFSFNFITSAKIESEETRTREDYVNWVLVNTDVEPQLVNAELNIFKSPRVNFVIGAGTQLQIGDNNLQVDLRYSLPLTKSELYTTDVVYDVNTYKNNEVFHILGKRDAEFDAPQFRLDDFKMGSIELSLAYTLFQK